MTEKSPLTSDPLSVAAAEELLPESEPTGRIELDTVAGMAASLAGAASVLVAAIGLIELWVARLGAVPVMVAASASGVLVTMLLAGAVWVCRVDRRGRTA